MASTVELIAAGLLLLFFNVSYVDATIGGDVTTTAGGGGAGGGDERSMPEKSMPSHADKVNTTTADAANLRATGNLIHRTVWGARWGARALLTACLDEHCLEVVRLGGGVGVAERLPAELEAVVVRELCRGAA